MWLRDDRYAVIGDMRGQNSAVLSGMSLSELNMVAVMDHTLHYAPRKYLICVSYLSTKYQGSELDVTLR